MSSNRVIKDSNGRHFRADSFDRFGDDLCEYLLSYLSFEDKIRLQCVAKQWLRTVFNRQRVLVADYWISGSDTVRQLAIKVYIKEKKNWELRCDSKRLKILLKKCRNIRKIVFSPSFPVDGQALDVITELCTRLESIALSIRDISLEAILRFGKRFGPTLKSIELLDNKKRNEYKFKFLLNFCTNIQFLRNEEILDFDKISRKPMPNLKELHFRTAAIDNNFFVTITQLVPKLKSLRLQVLNNNKYQILSISSPMANLEILDIDIHYLSHHFFKNLHKLSPKLKVLKLHLRSHISELKFYYLSNLKSLNELTINNNRDEKSITDSLVFHLINNCPKITKIQFRFRPNISVETIDTFIDIANKRPKLTFGFTCFLPESDLKLNELPKKPKNLMINVEQ